MANELILVVEDNDKNRKLVRDVLTFKGYEIIEAETGEEGVRLAQERHPSLVLMDIRLPGIDGIEALRRLRAEQATRGTPIMAMTASMMTCFVHAANECYRSMRSAVFRAGGFRLNRTTV
jgi:two-component system, cell cycle response regulator DivK